MISGISVGVPSSFHAILVNKYYWQEIIKQNNEMHIIVDVIAIMDNRNARCKKKQQQCRCSGYLLLFRTSFRGHSVVNEFIYILIHMYFKLFLPTKSIVIVLLPYVLCVFTFIIDDWNFTNYTWNRTKWAIIICNQTKRVVIPPKKNTKKNWKIYESPAVATCAKRENDLDGTEKWHACN